MQRIAILGGGPGGLMTAYRLGQRCAGSYEATIFESAPHIGGKLATRSFRTAPVNYESGAAECYDYRVVGADPLHDLVDELGLDTMPMQGQTVCMDGMPIRNDDDIARHLGTSTLAAVHAFRRRISSAMPRDVWHPGSWRTDNAHPWAQTSCEELLDTVADPLARRYLRIAVHSDLATETHLTTGLNGLKNFLLDAPGYIGFYAIAGGMSALADRLAGHLSQTEIELGARVRRIDRTPDGRYCVRFEQNGRQCQREFDAVIVAMPIGPLTEIEWGDDRLRRTMARHVADYDFPGHYLRVSLLFSGVFWRELLKGSWFMVEDFGGACVYDESRRFDTGHYGVLGFLLAGTAALNVGNLDQAEILRRVVTALPPALQRKAWSQLLQIAVHRWSGAISGQPGGLPQRDPNASHRPDPEVNPGLMLVGDYLFDSTLNGVLRSADVTTGLIAERLNARSHAA
jgi:monoamine oxidase